ncbi:COG3, partial [Symbiodinium necroappetens]
VCILLRSSLQRALEAAEAQVQEVLVHLQEQEDTSTVDTQIFYTNFHMISPSFRPALAVLLRHSRAQPQYAATLDELERFFAMLRLRLVAGAAAAHWASLREAAGNQPGSLPQLARQSVAYLMDTSSREQRCFEAFFTPRATQEALEGIFAHLGTLFQEAMQPACAASSWVDLAATAEVLKAELAEQREALASRTPVRSSLASLLGASRRRLFAEARRVLLSADLSDDLSEFQYPEAVFQAAARQPKSLSRPLALLSASYQVLEVSDFEALLDIVASSSPLWLRGTAENIGKRGAASAGFHGRFFLLRNLLALQEQLAAFEDDSRVLGVGEAAFRREDEFSLALERQSASQLRRGRGRRGAALQRLLEEAPWDPLGGTARRAEAVRNTTTFPTAPVQHHLPPFGTDVSGPKATNKFWANWVVEEGRGLAIHPMPYVLQFESQPGEAPNLKVSRSQSPHITYGDSDSNGRDKIRYYFSPVINEFGLGAIENAGQEGPVIVKEGLFGIHVELRGPSGTSRKMTFPIYSGMAYVSAFYEGGFTPKITSQRALLGVDPIQDGVWRLTNNGGREFRLYAILSSGEFADGTYQFNSQGEMNKPFDGWLRLAEVQVAGDVEVLDQHAGACFPESRVQSG